MLLNFSHLECGAYLKVGRDKELYGLRRYYFPYQLNRIKVFLFDYIRAAALI